MAYSQLTQIPSTIAEKLQELEDMTIQCMKCGECQAECPLYQNNFQETSVARGKISLLEFIMNGQVSSSDESYSVLDYCVHCGKCRDTCSSGVLTDLIFFKAKNILREVHPMSWKGKTILKVAMEKPQVMASASPFLHAGGAANNAISGVKLLQSLKNHLPGTLLRRNVKTPAKKSFTKIFRGWHYAEKEKMRVVFYPGCAINFIYNDWGEEITEFLNEKGVSVFIPDSGRCCGIPSATMGNLDLYLKNFHKNADELEAAETEYVITACPTCSYGIGELGESLSGRHPNFKVMDILVFLHDVLGYSQKISIPEKTSLHTPCHYDKDRKEDLQNIVNDFLDSDFVPLKKSGCCGFGGTFNLKNYDVSISIAKEKIDELREKDVSVLYAPCPGCAMQLHDAAKDSDIKVVHPISLMSNRQ